MALAVVPIDEGMVVHLAGQHAVHAAVGRVGGMGGVAERGRGVAPVAAAGAASGGAKSTAVIVNMAQGVRHGRICGKGHQHVAG